MELGKSFVIIANANKINKIPSDTADFVPVPPPGKLDETYASALIHYMTSFTKPEVHSVRGGPSHEHK